MKFGRDVDYLQKTLEMLVLVWISFFKIAKHIIHFRKEHALVACAVSWNVLSDKQSHCTHQRPTETHQAMDTYTATHRDQHLNHKLLRSHKASLIHSLTILSRTDMERATLSTFSLRYSKCCLCCCQLFFGQKHAAKRLQRPTRKLCIIDSSHLGLFKSGSRIKCKLTAHFVAWILY